MESRVGLTVFLRPYDAKFFEALLDKYHCDVDVLFSVMISACSSMFLTSDEIKKIFDIGGDK